MLKTLQAGRALAAISVVAFHLSLMMGVLRYGGRSVFWEYTKHGNLGVDFFFVLSGFIILFAHVHDIGNSNAWGTYIYRRFVRLFPIYWLYTIPFVLLITLGIGTDAKIPSSLGGWITSFTLIRFTDDSPPLTVAWTLFHELAFYATFSLLILSKRIGIMAFGLITVLCIVLYHFPAETERTAFNVYTSVYNLYFLFGMGAFWLYRSNGRGIAEFFIGICISTAALITMPLPHELSRLLLVFGFTLLLAGATKLELTGYFTVPFFLGFIGDASYTIYLVHEAFSGLLLKIAMKTHLYQLFGAGQTYMLVLAGTIALGCLTYSVVERPLLAECRRRYEKRSARQMSQ